MLHLEALEKAQSEPQSHREEFDDAVMFFCSNGGRVINRR
jgi:hypothetical protein